MDNTCPCNEARLLAEKANEQAQRALHDLHHTTVKGLQEALAAALAENERLRAASLVSNRRLLRAVTVLCRRGMRMHEALLLAIDAFGSDMRYVPGETERFILETAGLPYPARVEGSSEAAAALLRKLRAEYNNGERAT